MSKNINASKGLLEMQLSNMTEIGETLFEYYFGNGTGLIQMTHTCAGDPGNAYSLLTVAVNGSRVLAIALHPTHLWTKKTDKNLTDGIVSDCEHLLSNMTLNHTCPSWSFRIREDYRRVIGTLYHYVIFCNV